MLSVTKKFNFCYGHSLPGHKGKCKNIHGHNAELEVEFVSDGVHESQYGPGMIIDFSDIKKIIEPIIEKLDHQNLNDILAISSLPTCENLIRWIVEEIFKTEYRDMLNRIRLTETPDSWAEWRRDE